MNARGIFVMVVAGFLLLVVLGALLSSVPLYLIGFFGALAAYALACICTDDHNLGR